MAALERTLSFVTLQMFFMLKQQHYTLTQVGKVKKHNRTPLNCFFFSLANFKLQVWKSLLCSMKKNQVNLNTCWWVDNDRFFILGSTIPLNSPPNLSYPPFAHSVCVRQPAHADVKVLFRRVPNRRCFPSKIWRESHGPVDPSVAPTRTCIWS